MIRLHVHGADFPLYPELGEILHCGIVGKYQQVQRQDQELAPPVDGGEAPLEEMVLTRSVPRQSFARYAPNAVVQAGPGIPSWRWNTYQLKWSGPVDPGQEVRLVVMPRWLVSTLRFAAVGLSLLFAGILAAEIVQRRWTLPGGLTLGRGQAASDRSAAPGPSGSPHREWRRR